MRIGMGILIKCMFKWIGCKSRRVIYRWNYDLKNEKLKQKNQYHIGDRIRDLKYSKKNNVLFLLLENQKSIAMVFKD